MARVSKKQQLEQAAAEKKKQKLATRQSIYAVVFFALALLFAIYIYTPIEVPLKDWLVNRLFYGLFGFATFLFPLFLVWLGVDALDKDKKYSTAVKLWTGLVLATVISGFSFLI